MLNRENERNMDALDVILSEAGLDSESSLVGHLGDNSVVITREEFTPLQLIQTMEELGNIICKLLTRLELACDDAECEDNPIASQLMEMAGISENAMLDVQAYDGEIYITEMELPDVVKIILEFGNIKPECLRNLLLSDEKI